jgi:TRAP-type C4-dicarboxylate transport system substrate-binding protein
LLVRRNNDNPSSSSSCLSWLESAKAREATRKEQEREIAAAEAAGVTFLALSGPEKKQLAELAAPVYAAWGRKIGPDYLRRVQAKLAE